MRVSQKRTVVADLIKDYQVSMQRACKTIGLHRSAHYYVHHRREDRPVRQRIKDIAQSRVRYGLRRIHILLRREGWKDNMKGVCRIYREEGLNLRSKRPRLSKTAAHRLERPVINGLYECCSMDFVADQLFDGRKFRALALVDNFSCECIAIQVGQSLRGPDVVRVLNEIKVVRNIIPKRIQVDNGSAFIGKEVEKWAYDNNVTLDFSRRGKPTDNAFIESFNGSFRDECLNINWFLSVEDASKKIEAWREEYNNFRPHSSLGGMTPAEMVDMYKVKAKSK